MTREYKAMERLIRLINGNHLIKMDKDTYKVGVDALRFVEDVKKIVIKDGKQEEKYGEIIECLRHRKFIEVDEDE